LLYFHRCTEKDTGICRVYAPVIKQKNHIFAELQLTQTTFS